MKLYEALVTEKKKRGDQSPVKTRPILVVSDTVNNAKRKILSYWSAEDYKVGRPNMIADFNPR